jgi:hypothetical protein
MSVVTPAPTANEAGEKSSAKPATQIPKHFMVVRGMTA